MVIIFLLINLAYIIFSKKIYKKIINPIFIYSILFSTMITLYEIKLIYYNPLTVETWSIIIIFQLIFNLGSLIGNSINLNKNQKTTIVSEKKLRDIIVILTLIASIETISFLILVVNRYGIEIHKYTTQLYSDRLNGLLESPIPYLGSLVYVSLILSGYYFSKYKKILVAFLPLSLVVISSFLYGARLNIVIGSLFYVLPIVLNYSINNGIKKIITPKNLTIVFLFISLGSLMFLLTKNRASYIEVNYYMSPTMVNLVSKNPAFYQIYMYISSPVGVLNEFLKDPTYKFGGHTFLSIYNILNKFGMNIEINQYQIFYNIPIKSNVGTYIRELIEDFGFFFAGIATFIFSFLLSYTLKKYMKENNNIISLIIVVTLHVALIFSFFDWIFRSSFMWIILLSIIPLKIFIRVRIFHKKEGSLL